MQRSVPVLFGGKSSQLIISKPGNSEFLYFWEFPGAVWGFGENPKSVRISPPKILAGGRNGRRNRHNSEDRHTAAAVRFLVLCFAASQVGDVFQSGCPAGGARYAGMLATGLARSPGTNLQQQVGSKLSYCSTVTAHALTIPLAIKDKRYQED